MRIEPNFNTVGTANNLSTLDFKLYFKHSCIRKSKQLLNLSFQMLKNILNCN